MISFWREFFQEFAQDVNRNISAYIFYISAIMRFGWAQHPEE